MRTEAIEKLKRTRKNFLGDSGLRLLDLCSIAQFSGEVVEGAVRQSTGWGDCFVAVAASHDWLQALDQLHILPFIIGSAAIGLLGAIVMLLISAFRLLGEAVESYYEFRAKCAVSRQRYRAIGTKARADAVGPDSSEETRASSNLVGER